MQRVIICSKNPVKIKASQEAFFDMFPKDNFYFKDVSSESLVSDQPMGQKETLKGALNRVNNTKNEIRADFYVGIEGGIEIINNQLECFAWIVVYGGDKIGKAKTGSFFLPKKLAQLVKDGYELGEATDIFFNSQNAKQKGGAVGFLTGQTLTRASFYKPAIIMALIPFKNPKLY